jgi:hypothetical protein
MSDGSAHQELNAEVGMRKAEGEKKTKSELGSQEIQNPSGAEAHIAPPGRRPQSKIPNYEPPETSSY